MPRISAAVGRGAVNHRHDVAVVQTALSRISAEQAGNGPALWTRPVDGRMSPELEQAIDRFQTRERFQVTHRFELTGPGPDALERALPFDMKGLAGVAETDIVVCNACPAHAVEGAMRAFRESTLLPRAAATALADLARDIHRSSGLVLRPDGHGIETTGALVQRLALADVRWIGRDGRPTNTPPPDRVDTLIRALWRKQPGGGLEWVTSGPALAGPLPPPTQAQRVGSPSMTTVGGLHGGGTRLAVRTRDRLRVLSTPPRAIDHARLTRLRLPRTNDPVADRLLDIAAAEIEGATS